ncbi:MAG: MBL fold metallo-hydrolase [Planctomycetes bacterium]|nr:MBL fold metallo-hydrolase [Planctomycetota bacterium]
MFELRAKARTAPLNEHLSVPAQRGAVNIFWLGQAGFAIRSANSLIVIDPYLSDSLAKKYRSARFKHTRLMDAPIRPDELRGVDAVLSPHAHSDHLDPGSVGTIMALNPDCSLICPARVVPTALERGADRDRTVGMRAFEIHRLGSVLLEMLPSAHENLDVDAEGDTAYAGFVVETNGIRLYHSGDCVLYDGLPEILRERNIAVALLPVNGRDARRRENGIPGNFTLDEAAELCLAADIGYLIPHHFGLFDFNTVPPDAIASGLERYRRRGLRWSIPDTESYLSALPVSTRNAVLETP